MACTVTWDAFIAVGIFTIQAITLAIVLAHQLRLGTMQEAQDERDRRDPGA